MLLGEQAEEGHGGAVNTNGVVSLKAAAAPCWRERSRKFGLSRKELVAVLLCEN